MGGLRWIRHVVVLIALVAVSPVIAAQLTHIAILNQHPALSLGFEVTGKDAHQVFVLHHPERVVVDLNQTSTHLNVATLARSAPLIQRVRVGHPRPELLRLVFELKQPVLIKTIPRSKGWQLTMTPQTRSLPASRPPVYSPSATVVKRPSAVIHAPRSANRDVIVVLDPGHGGKDPGAIGIKRTREKQVVLAIAKRLKTLIDNQPGMRAVLTRNGDYYIGLRERMTIARRHNADLFIAIHADAFDDHHSHGASVFALSQRGATSEAARWLAAKENYSELGGVNLSGLDDRNGVIRSVLIDLSQTATIGASLRLGQQVLRGLNKMTSLHSHKVEQARFMVLKSPDIPSVLIETGFISNPQEELNLNHPGYQTRLCQAIVGGIKQYFWEFPPHGSRIEAMVNQHQHRSSQMAHRHRATTR
ncbi:MAG: N-acetylmuramoyl-L-alanine amidase [Legionella sp.]|nr:MAG: N-acetylmuramoyl-L-alanine amidase [Legionella sp.]